LAIVPVYGNFKTAACAQAVKRAARPSRRQSRQQPNFLVVALQQHFGDRRSAPEDVIKLHVTVRVAHQVGAGRMAQQVQERRVCFFGLIQARALASDPGRAPACARSTMF
jgi:hypothetical protein